MKCQLIVTDQILFGILFLLLGASLSIPSDAQSQGDNAVYASNGGTVASQAFLDASMFIGTGSNFSPTICGAIYGILSGTLLTPPQTFPPGGVIDARGISGTSALTCAAGKTPWNNGMTTVSTPSTILLPPTGATPIVISTMWVLPSNTHLIGVGDGIPGASNPGTWIQAESVFSGSSMIQFGTSACQGAQGLPSSCSGISVEKLTLDGNGLSSSNQPIGGIANASVTGPTYVDHVGLYRILGTGLSVSGGASNSGPYTNITFNTGTSADSTTVCAQIYGVNTRGIRGLTCTSNGTPSTGVLLDASNNSIRDVSIDGFKDAIAVGEDFTAQSNILLNISNPGVVGITNLIHICGNNSMQLSPCPTYNTVTDLAIIGVSTPPFNCPGGLTCVDGDSTIKDDVTGTFLSTQTDDHVGMYVLGESASSGYSRFTTSPRVQTWGFGTAGPQGSCRRGSLYSCTTPPSTNQNVCTDALWVCNASGGWTVVD
jgi:hypothetical protein